MLVGGRKPSRQRGTKGRATETSPDAYNREGIERVANPYMERYYPECSFRGFTRIDGAIAFFMRLNALLQPGFTVLGVGCGLGVVTSRR